MLPLGFQLWVSGAGAQIPTEFQRSCSAIWRSWSLHPVVVVVMVVALALAVTAASVVVAGPHG